MNDKQIELLQNLYNDASLGLTTGQKLYSYLKSNGETGYTLLKLNEFLKSLEVNQVLTKRRGDISFVAEGQFEQFQIDLIYMPKSWFNNGFKYIFAYKHNIQIIFALGQAPFVESFNKTMKNRMMKYMK